MARGLRLSYGQTTALERADVEVWPGRIIAVTGRSGSGKSSLLYCLAGVLRPDSGSVTYRGEEMTLLDDDGLTELRRSEFGFVFQFGELVPELTIAENVALPLRLNGDRGKPVRRRVDELLEELGVAALAGKRPAEVSGGEAQRAAVARALVHRPRVVFADEPTGSLDSDNSQIVLAQFVALAKTHTAAVVLVTHEARVAAVADSWVEVVDGSTRVKPTAP